MPPLSALTLQKSGFRGLFSPGPRRNIRAARITREISPGKFPGLSRAQAAALYHMACVPARVPAMYLAERRRSAPLCTWPAAAGGLRGKAGHAGPGGGGRAQVHPRYTAGTRQVHGGPARGTSQVHARSIGGGWMGLRSRPPRSPGAFAWMTTPPRRSRSMPPTPRSGCCAPGRSRWRCTPPRSRPACRTGRCRWMSCGCCCCTPRPAPAPATRCGPSWSAAPAPGTRPGWSAWPASPCRACAARPAAWPPPTAATPPTCRPRS